MRLTGGDSLGCPWDYNSKEVIMRTTIQTTDAPNAIGPYVQAVRVTVSDFVFLSGQIPLDPKTGELVKGDIEIQTRQVLKNLKAVLSAAGTSLENIVKTTIYLRNIDDFPIVNQVYGKFFWENPPARATIEVSALPKGALVEIEAVATIE